MPNATVKEQLIARIVAAGYDTVTACELVRDAIARGPGNYSVGPVRFAVLPTKGA